MKNVMIIPNYKNREEKRKYSLNYYYNHRKERLKYAKIYKIKNKEWLKECNKRYYIENRRKERLKSKLYYSKNRDKELERAKKYRKTNAWKIVNLRQNWKKRYKSSDNIDENTLRFIKEREKMYCIYCGIECLENVPNTNPQKLTYDHINPNGESTIDNLVLSCKHCNSSKNNKNVHEWLKKVVYDRFKF